MNTSKKSEQKDNHYLPQVYLRFFSCNQDRKTIDCYNLNTRCQIGCIPIKGQMQEDYFYGDDGRIEKELHEYEQNHKRVIEGLSKCISQDFMEVRNLIMLMHFRTKSRRDLAIKERESFIDAYLPEMTDDFLRYIRKSEHGQMFVDTTRKDVAPLVGSSMKEEYLQHKDIAVKNYSLFKTHRDSVNDLTYKIIMNNTQTNFIISDMPVLLINPFLQKRVKEFGINGLKQIGAILLLPLTPNSLLIFYDKSIYKIGNKRQTVIEVSNNQDVENLNKLQIINSQTNIYSSLFKDSDIKLIEKVCDGKKEWEHRHKSSGSYKMFFSISPLPTVDLSFLKILKKAKFRKMRPPFARDL